jgi:hypothetical protein
VLVVEHGKVGLDLFQVVREKIARVILDMTILVMSGEETLAALSSTTVVS